MAEPINKAYNLLRALNRPPTPAPIDCGEITELDFGVDSDDLMELPDEGEIY
eukprot:CAMPEP_0114585902 /NCGR_PEP_ID=MMETSP0125-20121206/9299_1 /TAXON_ID=485358 ORGANISM="Aristerostoma sp., Strain ATCC 50986" /NCGR_SAMPLE_ID=MMETSP0125 /ASSEMBLY_ACC=CAM_ASM_000245 /LENGTH=51 /DNA_ID=CAMNT_0001781151 /DNA_START=584 /DNA_END=739 /DNA_ORIENTATION=+